MKTLKNYILLAAFLGGTLTSCNFLDKEPTKIPQQEYFNTADEASSFLTGIYAILGQQSFYGGDYMYLVGGDDLSHYGGVNRAPASSGLICKNATASDAAVTALWYTLYSGINRANIFLENIMHSYQYLECNFLNLRFEYRGLIIAPAEFLFGYKNKK